MGFDFLLKNGVFRRSLAEQRSALQDYWETAGKTLAGSGVALKPLPKKWTLLRHNYFSVLFIAVFFSLGIPLRRLRLYARLNHCLRAWVTSCDNLLDRELKEMLKTDLPEQAMVFKSVHTLLVTDRVFFSFLLDAVKEGAITGAEGEELLRLSLSCLTESGLEEASEEAGVDYSLRPDDVLHIIHASKTGRLFTSPLAAPAALGDIGEDGKAALMREGLFRFGLGCQILDDINDIGMDLSDGKFNYLAALILHGPNEENSLLSELLSSDKDIRNDASLYRFFPLASERARREMLHQFQSAVGLLCDGGLPLGNAERTAFVKGLLVLFKRPEFMGRLRSL